MPTPIARTTPRARSTDSDGKIDCDDPDCRHHYPCTGEEYGAPFEGCTDQIDNDEDGKVDCDDPDCAQTEACNLLYGSPF